jgi:hypothetical protein
MSIRSFSAADILMLFEQGAGLHAIDRALLILHCAMPEADSDSLARLSLGQRDHCLLEVRQDNFGDRLDAFTECPACRERLEFSLSCAALLENTRQEVAEAQSIAIDGILFELRSPDSVDAAIAAASDSAERAADHFLMRCLRRADDGEFTPAELTVTQRMAIADELAARDPAAEILLDFVCSMCGHRWQALFEINHFLWREIRARARRLLQEVDALARVYHWMETEILGMSEARRALYLEMALS